MIIDLTLSVTVMERRNIKKHTQHMGDNPQIIWVKDPKIFTK